jgi:hypothetical protein
MGSIVELNDTLQISEEQGFPVSLLDIKKHLTSPYSVNDFEGKVFSFQNKPAIRMYKSPPVRNFLVQNIKKDGQDKWIYWGLIHILEITHDYVNQKTSGKYKILYIYIYIIQKK